ncbi:hypothetical protein CYR81_08905 [Enterococcus faecalis]|nr:hypothetical protein [Enterococcus faecalis]OFA10997.1 hypothetical protein ENFAE_25520 [Enterococcus faecalis]OFA13263.1 hypothetical protein ENFAE_14990 [Enterococcus faecalis]PLA80474.1 hypothetical protein CYR81_08905 [Enterococcus faecalis]
MKIIKSINTFILREKRENFKMNRRFILLLFLLGMLTSLLPVIIQLSLFLGFLLSFYTSWDEYLYKQSLKKRREQSQNV